MESMFQNASFLGELENYKIWTTFRKVHQITPRAYLVENRVKKINKMHRRLLLLWCAAPEKMLNACLVLSCMLAMYSKWTQCMLTCGTCVNAMHWNKEVWIQSNLFLPKHKWWLLKTTTHFCFTFFPFRFNKSWQHCFCFCCVPHYIYALI